MCVCVCMCVGGVRVGLGGRGKNFCAQQGTMKLEHKGFFFLLAH